MAGFRVLVATDGSRYARAAVATALAFPWPADTSVSGIVAARTSAMRGRPRYVIEAFERAFRRAAQTAQQALARRWPDVQVPLVNRGPVDAIVAEAQRLRVDVVVLGSRGHSVFRRILLGSVSRGVLRRARSSVLVVRRRPRDIRRFVLGTDGSPTAQRAVRLAARMKPTRGAHVTVVRVVDPIALPSMALLPSHVRSALRQEAQDAATTRVAAARVELEAAARAFREARWAVDTNLRTGAPLHELLTAVQEAKGDVLVVGARGGGAVEHFLLGSVAGGSLDHARVPVLVVK
jgi:nucleotide-binding universal stress UspA family protein